MSFQDLWNEAQKVTPESVDPTALAETAKVEGQQTVAAAPTAGPFSQQWASASGGRPATERDGGVGTLLHQGVVDIGSMAAGAAEYGLRQAAGDAAGVQSPLQLMASDLANHLQDARRGMTDYNRELEATIDPAVMDSIGREYLTLDPTKTIWRGSPLEVGKTVMYQFARSLPATVLTLLPVGRISRSMGANGAIAYMGASEASLSVGQIANNITDEITNMSEEDLTRESERYRQLLQETGSAETARTSLIQEAQGAAPLLGGIAVGAISTAAGRYLEPILAGKSGLGLRQRLGRGYVSEAAQEAPQSGIEQYTQNISAQVYDSNRALDEGVAESAVQGAVVGGLGGAMFAGITPNAPEAPQPTPPPTPEEQTRLRGESFDEVFTPQDRPQGPGTFDEVFAQPPQDPYVDQEVTAVQGRPDRYKVKGRKGKKVEVGNMFEPDPAVAAAVSANIRQDEKMGDLFEGWKPYTTPTGEIDTTTIAQQPDMFGPDVNTGRADPVRLQNELVPQGQGRGQQEMDIRVPRGNGAYSVDQPGQFETLPTEPDTTQPDNRYSVDERQGDLFGGYAPQGRVATPPEGAPGPRAEGWKVEVRDANTKELLDEVVYDTQEEAEAYADKLYDVKDFETTVAPNMVEQQAAVPDQPSAEPLSDIQAQIEDMTAGNRRGVYLSADNLAQLKADGVSDIIRGAGVQLNNFDGKGGLLIAKTRQDADDFIAMKVEDQRPMQEILGAATGAGVGKPMAGNIVVQLRNAKGNVVRETLVADEAEAFALSEQWGPNAVVLTADAAINRRNRMIAKEREARVGPARQAAQERGKYKAEMAGERAGLTEEEQAITKGATSPTKAAARLLGTAAKETAAATRQKLYGFFPASYLSFKDAEVAAEYDRVFSELVDAELTLNIKRDRKNMAESEGTRRRAEGKVDELVKQLGRLRKIGKPNLVPSKRAEAASRISKQVTQAAATELAQPRARTGEEPRRAVGQAIDNQFENDITYMDREQVDALSDVEIKQLFDDVVTWTAGQYQYIEFVPEWAGDIVIESDTLLAEEREFTGEDTTLAEEVLADEDVADAVTEAEAAAETWYNEAQTERKSVGRNAMKNEIMGNVVDYLKDKNGATIGTMRKFILRQMSRLPRREYGGKAKAVPIATTAKPLRTVTVLKNVYNYKIRSAVATRIEKIKEAGNTWEIFISGNKINLSDLKKSPLRGEYTVRELAKEKALARGKKIETGPLTRQTMKADESRAEATKRKKQYAAIEKKLTDTIAKADEKVAGFRTAPWEEENKFSALLHERDEEGNFTRAAQDAALGVNYVEQVVQLARAYLKANNQTSEAITAMSEIDAFLKEINALTPGKWIERTGKLISAESQESMRLLPRGAMRSIAIVPSKRALSFAQQNATNAANIAHIKRLNDIWLKNHYYKANISPMLHRWSSFMATDALGSSYQGTARRSEYIPTLEEMERLKFVMGRWKSSPATNDVLYAPLKKILTDFGVQFDKNGEVVITTDEEGKYRFESSEERLLIEARRINHDTSVGGTQTVAEKLAQTRQRGAQEAKKAKVSDREADIQQVLDHEKARGIVERFISSVNVGGLTTDNIARLERGVIAKLEKLGLWRQTSPVMGQILWGGIPKTYRLVGPRMMAGQMTRVAAVRQINTMSPPLLQTKSDTTVEVGKGKLAAARQGTPAKETVTGQFGLTDETVEAIGNARDMEEVAAVLGAIPTTAKDYAAAQKLLRDTPALQQTALDEELIADIDGVEYDLGVIDPAGNAEAFSKAAAEVGDILNSRYELTNINDVLSLIEKNVPAWHPYHIVAKKFRRLGMDATIAFDWNNQYVTDTTAKFISNNGERRIFLNRNKLMKKRASGLSIEAGVLHAILHETAHAATINGLRTNPHLRQAMMTLRDHARELFKETGIKKVPYGLQEKAANGVDENPIAEFVAEAFGSLEFQRLLKTMKVRGMRQSLWESFKSMVRNFLGFNVQEEESVFDVIMALDTHLFAGANAPVQQGVRTAFDLPTTDRFTAPIVGAAMESSKRVVETFNRVKTAGLTGRWGNRALLASSTMEQIRDAYARLFDYKGKNALTEYMNAFFQRDARNSELLAKADGLSREWTALTEKYGREQANEFSTIATDATMWEVAADKPAEAKANEHLTSPEQRAMAAKIRRRFRAMNSEWQAHYGKLQQYYRESLERETVMLVTNSLRSMVTGHANSPMTVEQFDKKYPYSKMGKFNTSEALMKEFGEMMGDKAEEQIEQINMIARIPQLRRGSYFPLTRYGDYIVTAEKKWAPMRFTERKAALDKARQLRESDPTLTVNAPWKTENGWLLQVSKKAFYAGESITEAQQYRDRLITEYGAENVSAVELKRQAKSELNINTTAGLNTLLEQLEGNLAAQNALKHFYLQSLADSSFRKHELKRTNRIGVDPTLQHRNFTTYAKAASYYTAQLQYGWRLADAVQNMQKAKSEMGDTAEATAIKRDEIIRELRLRDEMTAAPPGLTGFVRGASAMTQFWMLTSPSYWMINATQPWMVTLPYLAGVYGLNNTRAAMVAAQKLIASPLINQTVKSGAGLKALISKTATESAYNVLDDVKQQLRERHPDMAGKYIDMLDELRKNSIIDLSWVAELRDIAAGSSESKLGKIADASRIMAHLTEVNNRILSAIAAYELETSRGGTHEQGIQVAKETVSRTQFNYSAGNKARLFTKAGPLGTLSPLLFQFMQWPQHMYALLITQTVKMVRGGQLEKKEARRVLAGIFGTHLLVGGLLGAALQPMKWGIGLALMALGDDDPDETIPNVISGEVYDRWITEGLSDVLGTTLGNAIAKGAPTTWGWDVSSRVSLGNVYFIDVKANNPQEMLGSLFSSFGGATLSQGVNFARAAGKLLEGDVQRGLEMAMPKMGRDVLKAWRYANEGLVNNAGDTVIPTKNISPWDAISQGFGFSPEKITRAYAGQSAIMERLSWTRNERRQLIDGFREAEGPEARNEARTAIREFNRRFPGQKIAYGDILRSYERKRERELRYKRYGANISEKEAIDFAEYGAKYRD